ncbi:alpha N-terminal protein methyltransferase 1 [Drosophila grimshawi]|uniref:Alpha N-terminal protein methyltransferase 1 n=1 Tax=Drosophila grimshawi TaxID=7222 RepID=B4J614_DROGR|nr:alpha N-terminal protein methyltransferase 1 [Drosophila grimshawi]EDW01872.1 GH21679 [Drosophila grimshawi]
MGETIEDDPNQSSKTTGTGNAKVLPEFYNKAQKYWSEVPATVNGMLGGLGYINAIDIQGSKIFLRELKVPGKKLALDCGAGIGRVSRNLLMPLFETVDLVEQDAVFAEKARELCTSEAFRSNSLGEVYNLGLQEFSPTHKYDLIWSQWVLGHLTDPDLVLFFRRMRLSLQPNAYFCIKENVSTKSTDIKDDEDSSVTRPLAAYERFLKEAGFRIVRKVRQQNFPKGLFPVYMIGCKSKT